MEVTRKYTKELLGKYSGITKDTTKGFFAIPNYKELVGVGRSSLGKYYELEIFRKYFKDTLEILRTTKDTAEGFLGILNY